MKEDALFISLGHNSSVVYYDSNSKKIIGYEQEKLDRIKSSSYSPEDALLEIIKHVGFKKLQNINVYISDWFNFNQHRSDIEKYYSYNLENILKELNVKIHRLDKNFTHHDCHAYSVKAFFQEYSDINDYHVIVADGFGNDGEVISIYKKNSDIEDLDLIKRVYGYNYSLGLMYQYATSFVGMTENKDEYKFIMYESEIDNVIKNINIDELIKCANLFIDNVINGYNKSINKSFVGLFDYKSDLPKTREFIYEKLSTMLKNLNNKELYFLEKYDYKFSSNMTENEILKFRCVIGYIVQYAIEKAILKIIEMENIKNVLVVGGIFNNVKLNKAIIDNIEGIFSVHPICGDQGCAFGFYEKKYPRKFKYGDFKYGIRNLQHIYKLNKNVEKFDKENVVDFIEYVSNLIIKNNIVNVVIDNIEFGPRALCNTSTLGLPNLVNLKYINDVNGRDDFMPMAPVILDEHFSKLFKDNNYDKVIGSHYFMGVTYDYNNNIILSNLHKLYKGVMLKYPIINEYSGRPQIVENNSIIGKILKKVYDATGYCCIINTSFNIHGKTIPVTKSDVIENTVEQIKKDKFMKIKTVVLC